MIMLVDIKVSRGTEADPGKQNGCCDSKDGRMMVSPAHSFKYVTIIWNFRDIILLFSHSIEC